jgi:hypothetical protein
MVLACIRHSLWKEEITDPRGKKPTVVLFFSAYAIHSDEKPRDETPCLLLQNPGQPRDVRFSLFSCSESFVRVVSMCYIAYREEFNPKVKFGAGCVQYRSQEHLTEGPNLRPYSSTTDRHFAIAFATGGFIGQRMSDIRVLPPPKLFWTGGSTFFCCLLAPIVSINKCCIDWEQFHWNKL